VWPVGAGSGACGNIGMTGEQEAVWRKALQAKGKDWVMAELRRRPGQPGDAVFDIVFEEPFPTREFCEQWCAEEDNRLIHIPWHMTAALVFFILAIICGLQGVKYWNGSEPAKTPRPPRVAATTVPRVNPGTITNDIPNSTSFGSPRTSSTSDMPSVSLGSPNTSSTANTLPSVCSYATYETAECKIKK
jgi:hypothetical protein